MQEIKDLIEASIPNSEVTVTGEGASFQLKIVSDDFESLSALKRQQLVYGCINEKIKSGEIHAVTMQLFTQQEWAKQSKFL